LKTVAWWHCFAGIAGDMALASLLDAGADLEEVEAGLRELPVTGWHIEATRTTKCGLGATQLRVDVDGPEEADRTWGTIRALLEGATGLPERARKRSLKVFAALAAAEGSVHRLPAEEVHFHEVGGVDAVIDVVGTCLALELLDVSSVRSSPVAVGTGTVRAAHGVLPNPAPAVVELLEGAPVVGTSHDVELTTPTGAALLAGLADAYGPVPSFRVRACGYGAGTRDLEGAPNVLQVVLGELEVAGDGPATYRDLICRDATYQDLVVLEANVDDVTGEVLAHTVGALMGAGALDAWLVPVVGKKGRPGHVVAVLAEPQGVAELAGVLVAETGTLGFRQHRVGRWALPRRTVEVEVRGEIVRVKVGPQRLKAEYDDCARAAASLGVPVSEVARLAERAVARQPGAPVA
jgi:hypothetical protein